jgi:hypothetical protein
VGDTREIRSHLHGHWLKALIEHFLYPKMLLAAGFSLWVAFTPAALPSSSRVQKESRMFNEEFRVHVVCAVIGVGVDDQLRAILK